MLMALIAWKLGNVACETRGAGSTSPKGGYWAADVRGRQLDDKSVLCIANVEWIWRDSPGMTRLTANVITTGAMSATIHIREMLYIHSPVLLTDDGGRAPSLGLNVLGAP
jgi:hypothetical protein